jgi:hypothetical protein
VSDNRSSYKQEWAEAIKNLKQDVATLIVNYEKWNGTPYGPTNQELSFVDKSINAIDRALPDFARGQSSAVSPWLRQRWSEYCQAQSAMRGTMAERRRDRKPEWMIGLGDDCLKKIKEFQKLVLQLK